jgi:hypothetical protein
VAALGSAGASGDVDAAHASGASACRTAHTHPSSTPPTPRASWSTNAPPKPDSLCPRRPIRSCAHRAERVLELGAREPDACVGERERGLRVARRAEEAEVRAGPALHVRERMLAGEQREERRFAQV